MGVDAADNRAMDSGNGSRAEQPARDGIVRMRAAEWEAIGDDAKHVEDGRYYVLDAGAHGSRVVEVQFTDRKPRRISEKIRAGPARRS